MPAPRIDAASGRPPPTALQHTLADLLRFGGAAGFRWPPRHGMRHEWSGAESLLLDALAAGARDDRAALQACLAEADALCEALLSGPADWWAGAAAFLATSARRLELEAAVPPTLRRVLLAEELVCRREHAYGLAEVPQLLARLEAAGLRPMLLKGLAFAHLLYPEPHARPFGDTDVLLLPDEATRAQELLLADGFVLLPDTAHPAREHADRHHHLPPIARRRQGWTLRVELHARMLSEPVAGLETEAVLARSQRVLLGGLPVRLPCEEDLVAHLWLHHPGELNLRRALDALLSTRRLGPDGLRRARRALPPSMRWRFDLMVGVARHLDAGDLSRHTRAPSDRASPRLAASVTGLPLHVRAALRASCAPDWGRRHLLAVRRGEAGGLAGIVRQPLRAAFDRLDELQRALLPVLAREPLRRALALLRLPRDLWRARHASHLR